MIPIMGSETKNSRLVSYSNLTYRLGDESIEGKTEGIEAIKQAIYKILLTERFEYEIYDDNYGLKLKDLFGRDRIFVRAELGERITSALLTDDRITEVFDIEFTDGEDRGSLRVRFSVLTNEGSFDMEVDMSV